jgi:hypothetical protein
MLNQKISIFKAAMMPLSMPTYQSVAKLNSCSNLFKGNSNTYFRYNPILADIDTKLKAFVPDYIPAVG